MLLLMQPNMFYSMTSAQSLLIFGADVSNTFAEAPPPKQGFYIIPDNAFLDWWVNHKKNLPLPHCHLILILSAMQGHPESPCLWEKNTDLILWEISLTPTTHEPLMALVLFYFDRSMILLLPLWTPKHLTFSLTCWTNC